MDVFICFRKNENMVAADLAGCSFPSVQEFGMELKDRTTYSESVWIHQEPLFNDMTEQWKDD